MGSDTDNRTAAAEVLYDVLEAFGITGYAVPGWQNRSDIERAKYVAALAAANDADEQSVRVSEVLDLIANMDPTLLMWTGREGKRVAWVNRARLESEINQLAGKAET
jgi:hypothetical protein